MKTDYPDRMIRSSQVREIGPHVHTWKKVGQDSRGDIYQECENCGTRRFRTDSPGRPPLRQDWLDGSPWEEEKPSTPTRRRLSESDEG